MNNEQMEIKTPEYVSLQFRLAGLGSRAAAFIIDQILLGIVNLVLLILLIVTMEGMSSLPAFFSDSTMPIAIAIIAFFIINYGYFFFLEFFTGGRTLGKKLAGIRVIQENGHSITLLSSFIRNFLRLIDALPTGYFLGIILVFFHSKHKRLGDMVAGTIVVHERKSQRKKKKLTGIEKEIEARGLAKENLIIDEWTLKTFKEKDWKLLSTYTARLPQLPKAERYEMTRQIADLLLPKMGVETAEKNENELENILLVLYLHLRDEWEFEL
ncbi:RDD family protein [Neobacillus mesonae]|uniref:RDD family protein n=1 Tax=Neobacillus mesonae TaxID=1193713 RepID=UPI00203C558C|nr:RDD family protein [Neobacillus mesonae]MCM3567693.1 RDD family protein [Neobacillus mesonae]